MSEHYDFTDLSGICDACGENMDGMDVNVEAFEMTGLILCGGCADNALASDGGAGDQDEGLTPYG